MPAILNRPVQAICDSVFSAIDGFFAPVGVVGCLAWGVWLCEVLAAIGIPTACSPVFGVHPPNFGLGLGTARYAVPVGPRD